MFKDYPSSKLQDSDSSEDGKEDLMKETAVKTYLVILQKALVHNKTCPRYNKNTNQSNTKVK